MEDAHKALNNQPFYVVNDAAYNRMKMKLKSGDKFVKTYLGFCPHIVKTECNCPFNLNFLKDDMIVRINSGVIKPVIPFSAIPKEYLERNF